MVSLVSSVNGGGEVSNFTKLKIDPANTFYEWTEAYEARISDLTGVAIDTITGDDDRGFRGILDRTLAEI
jgi:hypothetical protein